MPTKPPSICPRCHNTRPCPCRKQAQRASDQARGTAAQRGYGSRWQRNSHTYLQHHPTCSQCGQPATVADHHPLTRRELLALHVPNPDAWHRLRPLCKPCHDTHTAATTPGGWANQPRP